MELEIALSLPDNSTEALRNWLTQLPHTTFERTTQLLNVYLDTPAHDLKKQKSALRLRFDTEQKIWIQTLKTAGHRENGVHIRQEWENQLNTPNDQTAQADIIPDFDLKTFANDAQAIITPLLKELRPVFHTDFTREVYQYAHNGDEFEIAFDSGRVRLLNGAAFTPIFEIEIEYKQGDITHMREIALKAQTALNATPQLLSKAARGFALNQS